MGMDRKLKIYPLRVAAVIQNKIANLWTETCKGELKNTAGCPIDPMAIFWNSMGWKAKILFFFF